MHASLLLEYSLSFVSRHPTVFTVDRKPSGYWSNEANRKKFFLDLANEMAFDPFERSNWNKVTTTQVNAKVSPLSLYFHFFGLLLTRFIQGGSSLLQRYKGSLQAALAATFP